MAVTDVQPRFGEEAARPSLDQRTLSLVTKTRLHTRKRTCMVLKALLNFLLNLLVSEEIFCYYDVLPIISFALQVYERARPQIHPGLLQVARSTV